MPLRLATAVALCTLSLTACGTSNDGEDTEALLRQASDDGPVHVHGLGIDPADDALIIATHTGLFRAASGEQKARRIGAGYQDTMGFTVVGRHRFLGSGHPDARDDLPPLLGLVRSDDAGRTWRPVSLLGEADFHVLRWSDGAVYGYDSSNARLLVSVDGGRTWQSRAVPSQPIDLVVDPRDRRQAVTSTEDGIFASRDEGRTWRPLTNEVGGLLAWPRHDRLFMLGGGGTVEVSSDGGRSWREVGRLDGQPAAFVADGDDLYAALHDGTVKASTDGGSRWALRARP